MKGIEDIDWQLADEIQKAMGTPEYRHERKPISRLDAVADALRTPALKQECESDATFGVPFGWIVDVSF